MPPAPRAAPDSTRWATGPIPSKPQLAHSDQNNVRRACNHATYFEERQVMMQDWADHLRAMESCRLSAPRFNTVFGMRHHRAWALWQG